MVKHLKIFKEDLEVKDLEKLLGRLDKIEISKWKSGSRREVFGWSEDSMEETELYILIPETIYGVNISYVKFDRAGDSLTPPHIGERCGLSVLDKIHDSTIASWFAEKYWMGEEKHSRECYEGGGTLLSFHKRKSRQIKQEKLT